MTDRPVHTGFPAQALSRDGVPYRAPTNSSPNEAADDDFTEAEIRDLVGSHPGGLIALTLELCEDASIVEMVYTLRHMRACRQAGTSD